MGDCDKRFDFADVELSEKYCQEYESAAPLRQCSIKQADKRGNEKIAGSTKGEDKARTVKQNIHFGTDQRTKIKALPASL